MPDLTILPVLAAAVAAFVIGGGYYAVFGAQLAGASDADDSEQQMPAWELAVEVIRCLMIAVVVAGLASQGDIETVGGGLLLGLALWIGFPFVLWTGAMVHEKAPLRLAVIHGGDWLAKLLAVAVIVSVWQ